MKALLIVLGILILLALIPLGAHVRYDSEGPYVAIIAGPVKIQLLPKKQKKKKDKKEKKPKKKKEKKPKEQKPKEDKPKEKKPIGGLIKDFYPFVQLGFSFLGCFFRKLKVKILTLHVGFGGAGDAAKAAINYGRAWAAIGTLMPKLRKALNIKKENVSASCDFTSDEMRIYAELKLVFLLGDLIGMALRYGFRALKLYLAMKKRHKQEKTSDKAVSTK